MGRVRRSRLRRKSRRRRARRRMYLLFLEQKIAEWRAKGVLIERLHRKRKH